METFLYLVDPKLGIPTIVVHLKCPLSFSRQLTRGLLLAATVDLLSGFFLTTGLLLTGSSVFVVIYGTMHTISVE